MAVNVLCTQLLRAFSFSNQVIQTMNNQCEVVKIEKLSLSEFEMLVSIPSDQVFWIQPLLAPLPARLHYTQRRSDRLAHHRVVNSFSGSPAISAISRHRSCIHQLVASCTQARSFCHLSSSRSKRP